MPKGKRVRLVAISSIAIAYVMPVVMLKVHKRLVLSNEYFHDYRLNYALTVTNPPLWDAKSFAPIGK